MGTVYSMSENKKQFKKIDVEKLNFTELDLGKIDVDKLKMQQQSIAIDIDKTLSEINRDFERKKKLKL
jgi:hypothetical protein